MNIPIGLADRVAAGLGPAPAPERAAAVIPSRAAAGVLEALQRAGHPLTTAELAEALGQHPNTVREHLDALVEAGVATRSRAAATGRGRPALLYAAAPGGGAAPREYAGLARALATHLARSSARPTEDALEAGYEWGTRLAEEAGQPRRRDPGPGRTAAHAEDSGSADARHGVVALLEGLGFAPDTDRRAEVVRLRRCPLLDVAVQHPEVVCGVHLGIARGALGAWGAASADTSLVPFAEPGACLLHLAGARDASVGWADLGTPAAIDNPRATQGDAGEHSA